MKRIFTFLLLLSYIISYVLCFIIKLHPYPIKQDLFLSDLPSLLFSNISMVIPTIQLCFGNPTNQCLKLLLCTKSSYTLIERSLPSSIEPEYYFKHQFNQSPLFPQEVSERRFGYYLFNKYEISANTTNSHITFTSSNLHLPHEKQTFKYAFINQSKKPFTLENDGILGLRKFYSANLTYPNPAFSFIDYLYHKKEIKYENIALSYDNQGGGYVVFGENTIAYDFCATTNFIISSYDWGCGINEINIGEKSLHNDNMMHFDSGMNAITVNWIEDGKMIFNYIIKKSLNKCYIDSLSHQFILVCQKDVKVDQFPDIHLKGNNTDFVIKWKYLFISTIIDQREVLVSLLICDNNELLWTIGIPGFINKSLLFDYETKMVAIKRIKTVYTSKINIVMIWLFIISSIGIILNVFVKKILLM